MAIEIPIEKRKSTLSIIRQRLTCLMAVTVITKNRGRPLVTGLVGVSTITYLGRGRQKTVISERCNIAHVTTHVAFQLKSSALTTSTGVCVCA